MIVRGESNTQSSTARMLTLLALCLASLSSTFIAADPLDDALQNPARPAADRDRDQNSLPAETLRFFGLPQGGVVLDLFGGGGYYSEIVSRVIGANGKVYLHNNKAYLGFAGDALEERLRGDRLPNVTRYDREIDAIDLPNDSVDMVLMVMTYHDLYYRTDTWKIDPEQAFSMLHRVLKPGGVLAIIDHIAKAGSGTGAAQELHRIDPAFARRDIEGHGFIFDGASTLLENGEDPLDIGVFDPAIRSHTSRFIYRFIEP